MKHHWKTLFSALFLSMAAVMCPAAGLPANHPRPKACDAKPAASSKATVDLSDFDSERSFARSATGNAALEGTNSFTWSQNRTTDASDFALAADMCAGDPGEAKPASEAKPATTQQAETFEKQITIKLDYLLSLPTDYTKQADKKWPLILFLHGSGERGTDVNLVRKHGPPKIIDQQPDSVLAKDFIVVSPQCPPGRWWKVDDLIALLDDVQTRYHVDADRVYVTGLSMGGFGTWELASAYPDRFAAIAPMCGGGRPELAKRMKNLPIWVFHGEADNAVPFQRSVEMVEALKKVGNDVKFTSYPGVGHDCWTQSYNNPELYTWLLSHKRGEKSTEGEAKTK